MRRRRWLLAGGAVCILALAIVLGSLWLPDRDALWRIVDGRCVPNLRLNGNPAPCVQVDLARGFAVLRDRVGIAQFLLIPTRRVSGIESPSLLARDAPNDWAAAWEARHHVEHALGHSLPRTALSMAVNSRWGRTQDQLHIHIDCVRPDVAARLAARRADLSTVWAPFPEPLAGRHFRALRVADQYLTNTNLFHVLAQDLTNPRSQMGHHTLVMVGMIFDGNEPGFVALDGSVDLLAFDLGRGEDLQDHGCGAVR